MKILVAAFISLSLGSVAGLAQQPTLQSDGTYAAAPQTVPQTPSQTAPSVQRRPHNPVKEARHLSKELSLTPDQSSQVQTLFADRDSRVAALQADTTLAPKAVHRQMHQIQQDTNVKLIALLTPQQQQLFADMKASHKHQGAPQGSPLPAPNA